MIGPDRLEFIRYKRRGKDDSKGVAPGCENGDHCPDYK